MRNQYIGPLRAVIRQEWEAPQTSNTRGASFYLVDASCDIALVKDAGQAGARFHLSLVATWMNFFVELEYLVAESEVFSGLRCAVHVAFVFPDSFVAPAFQALLVSSVPPGCPATPCALARLEGSVLWA